MLKHFNYSEFDSPDVQGSGQMMDKRILEMLDQARDKFDKPIHITSGFRTPFWNGEVNGVESSSHLKGLAADIHCDNSRDRHNLINCLLDVGFKRIGVAEKFIHVDIDPDKSQDLIWLY
jgi:uncharacterized protein YcbK (DUF882 family)